MAFHLTEDVTHFLLHCPFFKEMVDSVWLNIKARITETEPLDGTQICNFVSNLDGDSKVLLLLGGLPLSFDNETVIRIKRFISSAVGKIFKVHITPLTKFRPKTPYDVKTLQNISRIGLWFPHNLDFCLWE